MPAPPTKFRCSRTRMMLTIRVTLHHVGAAQINLKTSRKKIELDTLRARRKFKLARMYPRGIECDDTQTSARLDGGALVVEMPITKLPAIGGDGSVAAASPPLVVAPEGGKKRKRALTEATSGAVKKMAQGEEGAKTGSSTKVRSKAGVNDSEDVAEATDRGPKKKRKQPLAEEPPPQRQVDEDEDTEKPRDKRKRGTKGTAKADVDKRHSGSVLETTVEDGRHAAKKAEPSEDRMWELMEQASSAAAEKRDTALGRMRRLEEIDDEKTQKAKAKQEERAAKKKLLLETFRRQQAAAKAETKAAVAARKPRAAEREGALAATGTSRKKRVSFGSDV